MPVTPPIDLQRDDPRPLHLQLTEGLRSAILDGRFRRSERLPPIRQLATDLGIARATVVSAYEQLAVEGYLVARVGSGTRVAPELPEVALVAPMTAPRPAGPARPAAPPPDPRLPDATYLSERTAAGSVPFDFRPGRPGYDLFPAQAWERLLRDAWRDLVARERRGSLDYPDPAGLPRLRRALADHLSLARAVRARPEQVTVLAGSQAAFATAARLWLGPGTTAVLEDPGYPMARRVVLATGARLATRLVDRHGLPTDRLPENAALAVVTPSWQFPLGGTLPIARRLALLEWSRRAGAVIVEDDYDSELRYAGRPLASLQGLDEDGRVLYVGTLSKVAFPALRLGYAVVPDAIAGPFAAALELVGRGVPVLEQLALARFVESGAFERHLRRMRIAYAERQAALVEAVRVEAAGLLEVEPAPAGMHLVGRLVDDLVPPASEVARAARAVGVNVAPVAGYRLAPAPDRELVLGYPALSPGEIREGIRRFGRSLRALTHS